MKPTPRFFLVLLAIAIVLFAGISQVSAAQISEPTGSSALKIEITYTGVIEKMDQNQWVVNGRIVTVDLAQAGSFQVGDSVKVEGLLQPCSCDQWVVPYGTALA